MKFDFFNKKGCNFVTFWYNIKGKGYKIVIFGRRIILSDVISLMIKSVKLAASTIKNSSSKVKKGIFAFVAVVAIFASLSFNDTRIAYNVSYKGHVIAVVKNKQQFNDAKALVVNMVDGSNIENVVEEPTFNKTVALRRNINNTVQVADAIIDNTDEIVEASVLLVDGNQVACAEKEILEELLNTRLNRFNFNGQDCISRFEKEVTVKDDYFVLSKLDDKKSVQDTVNSLAVITEVTNVTDVMVPYKSTVKKTNEQVIGYEKVSVAGSAGIDRVTQKVVMVNGNVQSTETVSTENIVKPIDEVIVKGTASASLKHAKEAGFIFPLPKGTWQVSAYYGDGRNHKAVDLRAKSGTSIFAVASGKVVQSGWNGNYGYCVTIEHENGMRTLYAHAKQLCCKVGDTVSQGEVIALVGTTGQSTGNHLHFEVIVGGRNVNPAPYINLD